MASNNKPKRDDLPHHHKPCQGSPLGINTLTAAATLMLAAWAISTPALSQAAEVSDPSDSIFPVSTKVDDSSLENLLAQINALVKANKTEQAFALADQHSLTYEGEPAFDLPYGHLAFDVGKYELAIFPLERMLNLDPLDKALRIKVADAYSRIQLNDYAAHELEHAREQTESGLTSSDQDIAHSARMGARKRWEGSVGISFGKSSNANRGSSDDTLTLADGSTMDVPFELMPQKSNTGNTYAQISYLMDKGSASARINRVWWSNKAIDPSQDMRLSYVHNIATHNNVNYSLGVAWQGSRILGSGKTQHAYKIAGRASLKLQDKYALNNVLIWQTRPSVGTMPSLNQQTLASTLKWGENRHIQTVSANLANASYGSTSEGDFSGTRGWGGGYSYVYIWPGANQNTRLSLSYQNNRNTDVSKAFGVKVNQQVITSHLSHQWLLGRSQEERETSSETKLTDGISISLGLSLENARGNVALSRYKHTQLFAAIQKDF